MKNRFILGAAALFITIALVSFFVFNRAQDLKFETIDQGEILDGYIGSKQPNVLILSQNGSINNPGKDVQFPNELAEKLRSVDYDKFFVIILFRGDTPGFNEKYTIDALSIIRSRNRVIIKTSLGNPSDETIIGLLHSYPYRIIKVSKSGQWNQEITFILDVDGKEMDRQKLFVP